MVLRALLPLRLEFETLKMILEIGTGVEKAELRVKRSAKKAEKKQEATRCYVLYDSSVSSSNTKSK